MVFITDVKAKRIDGRIEVTITILNLAPPLFPYYSEAETDIGTREGFIGLAMPPGFGDVYRVSDRHHQARRVTARVKFLGQTTDEKTISI